MTITFDEPASQQFPRLRAAIGPEVPISTEDLESAVRSAFGESVDADDLEGFFSTLGDIVKVAAPIVGSVVPGVGTLIGGAVGQIAGSALKGADGGGRGAARPPRPRPRPVRRTVAPPSHAPATSQLIGLLNSPALGQALAAIGAGSAATTAVPLSPGGPLLKPSMFLNVLSRLAGEAAESLNEGLEDSEAVVDLVIDHLLPATIG